MGFRAQAGTLHLAQLLSKLIVLQHRRNQEHWLISFDKKKKDFLTGLGGNHLMFYRRMALTLDARIVSCVIAFGVDRGMGPNGLWQIL